MAEIKRDNDKDKKEKKVVITNKKSKAGADKREKYFTHGSAAVKVLCVFAAFCLWIYVMLVESPEYEQTFASVTVELVNTEDLVSENGLMLYSGYGNMVGVTLSGKKSVVSKLSDSDIVVTADVGRLNSGSGRYDCKLSVDVPAGCKLVSLSQDTISVYVDLASQTTVRLTEKRENTNLPEGCYMGAIEYPVDMITVEGPEKLLSRVYEARFDNDMSGITRSTSLTQKVYLVDEYGSKIESPYIKYYPQEVTVNIPVLKSVSVPVELVFKNGFFNLDNTSTTVTPSYIRVTGDPDVIDAGNLIERLEIDETTDYIIPNTDDLICDKKVLLKASADVELDSDIVQIYSVPDSSIKSRKITIPGKNIVDTGGKNGVSYTWDRSPVTVRLIGSLEAVSSISAEDITLTLDMSPYSETNTGKTEVRAEVVIDSEYKDELLAIGVYEITVTFTND